MKTIKIIFLFFLLSMMITNAENKTLLKSKTYYQSADSLNWQLKGQEHFEYDLKGRLSKISGTGKAFVVTEWLDWSYKVVERIIDTINVFDYYDDGNLKVHYNRNVLFIYYPDTSNYFWRDTIRNFHYNQGKISEILFIAKESGKNDSIIFKYTYYPNEPNQIVIFKQYYYLNTWQDAKIYKFEFYNEKGKIIRDSLIENYREIINEYKYDTNGNIKTRILTIWENYFHAASTTYYSNDKVDSILYKDEELIIDQGYYRLYKNEWQDRFEYNLDRNLLSESKYYQSSLNSIKHFGYEKINYTYDNFSVEVRTNEHQLSEAINISPNPATDFIEISVPTSIKRELGGVSEEVRIFNVYGQVVSNLTPTLSMLGEGVRIDVSGLAPGVYFVRIGERVMKFLKI